MPPHGQYYSGPDGDEDVQPVKVEPPQPKKHEILVRTLSYSEGKNVEVANYLSFLKTEGYDIENFISNSTSMDEGRNGFMYLTVIASRVV